MAELTYSCCKVRNARRDIETSQGLPQKSSWHNAVWHFGLNYLFAALSRCIFPSPILFFCYQLFRLPRESMRNVNFFSLVFVFLLYSIYVFHFLRILFYLINNSCDNGRKPSKSPLAGTWNPRSCHIHIIPWICCIYVHQSGAQVLETENWLGNWEIGGHRAWKSYELFISLDFLLTSGNPYGPALKQIAKRKIEKVSLCILKFVWLCGLEIH